MGGKEVQLPIVNHTACTVEVQANDLLARRAKVIQAPQTITEPYTRPLSYRDIQKPEGLDTEVRASYLLY